MRQAYMVEVNRLVYVRETYLIEGDSATDAGDKVFDKLSHVKAIKYEDHDEPHKSSIMEQYHGTDIEFIDGPVDVE